MALTVENALLDGERVGLRCEDGKIAVLGPEVVVQSGDEAIDAGGARLLPPLVNGHTHAAMTLFRGSGDDLPLMPWLEQRIWPIEAKLEAEDVYWGARLACAEMIRGGAGRFWDMYWQPEATARAVEEMGIRAAIGAPLIDLGGEGAKLRESALRSLEALAQFGPLVTPALAPHAIYTVSEESLRWIAELSAERNLPVQIHLSETEKEVQDCIAEHGCRPVFYLERLGLLSERAILAHGVWLDPDELALIAERGATVVTNPAANMKLAVGGVFSFPAAGAPRAPGGGGPPSGAAHHTQDQLAPNKKKDHPPK
ncbi:MAG: amidohydrolase family protein, partial [Solirubrobacterales bacterium]